VTGGVSFTNHTKRKGRMNTLFVFLLSFFFFAAGIYSFIGMLFPRFSLKIGYSGVNLFKQNKLVLKWEEIPWEKRLIIRLLFIFVYAGCFAISSEILGFLKPIS
jgi:hypothetical protein